MQETARVGWDLCTLDEVHCSFHSRLLSLINEWNLFLVNLSTYTGNLLCCWQDVGACDRTDSKGLVVGVHDCKAPPLENKDSLICGGTVRKSEVKSSKKIHSYENVAWKGDVSFGNLVRDGKIIIQVERKGQLRGNMKRLACHPSKYL